MKISSIKEILVAYDNSSGVGRGIRDEPHIKELREFHAKLPQVDRDLTPNELYKLIIIGLGKKSTNGSASCVAFDTLFRMLGDRQTYSFLQKERCLNEDLAFFVSNHKNNPYAMHLIHMLIRYNQSHYLPELYKLNEEALKFLFDNLMVLEKENETLLTESNIVSFLKFAEFNEALINLGHFLSALSTIKQLQQKQLDHLFQHVEELKRGTHFKRVLDYIFASSWNMLDYIHLVIANGGPQMGKALDMMEKMGHLSDAQKELLFDTVLKNLRYFEQISTGLKSLSEKNADFFEMVLSQPQYADKIAAGAQVLTRVAPFPKMKETYEIWVWNCADEIDDLLMLIKFLEERTLCNPYNISRFLSINLNIKSLFLIVQKLFSADLLSQANLNLLLDKATEKNLASLLSKSTTLAEYCQLNQKNFECLLANPEIELSKLQHIKSSGESTSLADLVVAGLSFLGGKPDKESDSEYGFNPNSSIL